MPWTALVNPIAEIVKRVIPDRAARDEAIAELNRQAQAGELQVQLKQIEVNIAEAKHKNVFVAGWRPLVGYCCATGLFYNTVLAPALGLTIVESDLLTHALLGLLGLGGMRTYEKTKGVA